MEKNSMRVSQKKGHDNEIPPKGGQEMEDACHSTRQLLPCGVNFGKSDIIGELQTFSSPEFGKIRCIVIAGEMYIAGKDAATALGYSDTADALKKHVDDEDKLTWCFTGSGQRRQMYIINISGLFSLVLSSNLASAKGFKRWVTSEVLPSIYKYGAYVATAANHSLTREECLQAAQIISQCNKDTLPTVLCLLKQGSFSVEEANSPELTDPVCRRYHYLQQLINVAISKEGYNIPKRHIAEILGVAIKTLYRYINDETDKPCHKDIEDMIQRLTKALAEIDLKRTECP